MSGVKIAKILYFSGDELLVEVIIPQSLVNNSITNTLYNTHHKLTHHKETYTKPCKGIEQIAGFISKVVSIEIDKKIKF